MKRNKETAFAALIAASLVAGARILTGTPLAANPDEYLLAPLRVHLLSAREVPDVSTTLAAADVTRILQKINRVWAQAGLHFYLESLRREEAANPDRYPGGQDEGLGLLSLRPDASKAPDVLHVYFIKRMSVNGLYLAGAIFVKDTASLREVDGGIDEPLPRVTSHELGHAFGLPHRQNRTNLMASGTTGIWLNEEEVRIVREQARRLPWIESAAAVKQKAADLAQAGKTNEAALWYRRLSDLAK